MFVISGMPYGHTWALRRTTMLRQSSRCLSIDAGANEGGHQLGKRGLIT
jgi:hypothetical protein